MSINIIHQHYYMSSDTKIYYYYTKAKQSFATLAIQQKHCVTRRAGRIKDFLEGGGGGRIFKKLSKILTFFFRSTKLIFRALPKHGMFCPYFGQIFAPQAKF